jgi:hypothetical protein
MSIRTCTYLDSRQRYRCTECEMTVDLCQCQNVNEMAAKRVASDEGRFLRAVWTEVQNSTPRAHTFVRLVTDIGLLGCKLVDNTETPGEVSTTEIQRELVKIAALLTHLATSGTPEYAYPAE